MPHYFHKKQNSKMRVQLITDNLRGNEIKIMTSSGVFSKKRVDKGSKLLIEKGVMGNGWKVLDLGCGSGVVGIAIKKAFPENDVVQSDINERAIMLTKKNAKLNDVKTIVLQSDGFRKIKSKFDVILLNPPQTAGKDICFKLIEESKKHIVNNGLLQVVVRSQKGGKQIATCMENVFGNVETIARGGGYRILISKKKISNY